MEFRRFRTSNPTLIVFIIIALAVWVTNPFGDFPIGDDWQYAYPVKTWLENGKMEFKGIFAPNILLQVVWGYLFCKIGGTFSFEFLRLSTIIASGIGLIYFYKILKQAGLSKLTATLVLLTLAFSPLYFHLSFSFFTDVPFLTLCFVSIYYFQKHLKLLQAKHLVFASIAAVASFYIRQPGLLLFPAFAGTLLIQQDFSKAAWVRTVLLALVTIAVYFSLEKWVKPMLEISDNFVPVGGQFYTALIEQPLSTFAEWGKKAIKTFVYLGFFGLPLIPFFWKKIVEEIRQRKSIAAIILLANIALLLVLIFVGKTFPFGGNILFNFGLGPELLTDVYTFGLSNTPKLPNEAMLLIQLISQLSATCLILQIAKSIKMLDREQQHFIVFLVLFNIIYLPVMSITSFFDRYLLITIASFFIILGMITTQKIKLGWNLIPFFLMTLFSVMATRDFMSWNRAKSTAFNYLIKKGIPITEMDAGYEYNGFYNYHYPRQKEEGKSFWWVTDDKYMITFGPVSGFQQVASFPYYRCLFFREDEILILKKEN